MSTIDEAACALTERRARVPGPAYRLFYETPLHPVRTPATVATSKIVNAKRDRGVLLSATGEYASALKIRPPLRQTKSVRTEVSKALPCHAQALRYLRASGSFASSIGT